MYENGSTVIQEIDEAIRVTIFRKDSSHVPSGDPTTLPLSDLERSILSLLQNEPKLKIREIATELDVGESQIKHATVRLKKGVFYPETVPSNHHIG